MPADGTADLPPPRRTFPLVRHLSYRLTPLLMRRGLTPNQVTGLSLLAGLAAAACFGTGSATGDGLGALALLICYVLDNCDGELARLTGRCTPFGLVFDTTVDWLVHTALFIGLGVGVSTASGDALWWWLGLAAAVGTTINSAMAIPRDVRAAYGSGDAAAASAPGADDDAEPQGLREHLLYAFRELSRADFCFIVLLLAPLGALWVLLPAGAIGAQVYWLTGLLKGAERFHV